MLFKIPTAAVVRNTVNASSTILLPPPKYRKEFRKGSRKKSNGEFGLSKASSPAKNSKRESSARYHSAETKIVAPSSASRGAKQKAILSACTDADGLVDREGLESLKTTISQSKIKAGVSNASVPLSGVEKPNTLEPGDYHVLEAPNECHLPLQVSNDFGKVVDLAPILSGSPVEIYCNSSKANEYIGDPFFASSRTNDEATGDETDGVIDSESVGTTGLYPQQQPEMVFFFGWASGFILQNSGNNDCSHFPAFEQEIVFNLTIDSGHEEAYYGQQSQGTNTDETFDVDGATATTNDIRVSNDTRGYSDRGARDDKCSSLCDKRLATNTDEVDDVSDDTGDAQKPRTVDDILRQIDLEEKGEGYVEGEHSEPETSHLPNSFIHCSSGEEDTEKEDRVSKILPVSQNMSDSGVGATQFFDNFEYSQLAPSEVEGFSIRPIAMLLKGASDSDAAMVVDEELPHRKILLTRTNDTTLSAAPSCKTEEDVSIDGNDAIDVDNLSEEDAAKTQRQITDCCNNAIDDEAKITRMLASVLHDIQHSDKNEMLQMYSYTKKNNSGIFQKSFDVDDFKSTLTKQWVTGNVVCIYTSMIMARIERNDARGKLYIHSPYFFNQLMTNNQYDFSKVQKQVLCYKLMEFDTVLIPITGY